MIPHNLPPIPGKLYQFTTSAGIVRFRVEMVQDSGFDGEPYLVFPCSVVSGEDNPILLGFEPFALFVDSRLPGWVYLEIVCGNYTLGSFPEYQYTPCSEV